MEKGLGLAGEIPDRGSSQQVLVEYFSDSGWLRYVHWLAATKIKT